jgi:hypothetical protein
MTREQAVSQALGILQKGGGDGQEVDGGGGRGRGMRGRGRGRGRGGRGRRDGEGDWRREGDEDGGIASGLYLGDNADGEKLAMRLGPKVMNQLTEAFEDMSTQVLPSPLDDAYVDALHTNCMVWNSSCYAFLIDKQVMFSCSFCFVGNDVVCLLILDPSGCLY